jgi:hypothetical protein
LWEFMAKGLDFGLGLWRLYTKLGRRLHWLYFIGYFQPISLYSQQSLAIQSHGLSTWTAIIMWSGHKWVSEGLVTPGTCGMADSKHPTRTFGGVMFGSGQPSREVFGPNRKLLSALANFGENIALAFLKAAWLQVLYWVHLTFKV